MDENRVNSAPDASSRRVLPPTVSNPELLVDGSDQTIRRLTLGFAVLGWLLVDIRSGFGKIIKVSPFQYVSLQAIARITPEEPWTVRSIAQHFRVSKAHVSVELHRLIKKGYILSKTNPADKRSKYLTISDKGLALLESMASTQQEINDRLYSQFDQKTLVEQCQRIERMIEDAERAREHLYKKLEGEA